VRNVLIFVWLLAFLAIVWGVVIMLLSRHSRDGLSPWYFSSSWYIEDTHNYNGIPVFTNPIGNSYLNTKEISSGVQNLCAILFTCAIQGAQTIGLHCVELLVNISRDEKGMASGHSAEKGVQDWFQTSRGTTERLSTQDCSK
jgi:hypothetical protein